MKYYIFFNSENKLDGCGTCYTDGAVEISQEKYEAFIACPNKFDYINGELKDISDTQEYKLSEFQKAVQYQHDAFNEYSREIVYQIQYNTILGNTTMIMDLEEQLQAEQQAVIERINSITEAYNAST